MKLIIDQCSDHREVEITIKCGIVDSKLEKLISQIRLYAFSILDEINSITSIAILIISAFIFYGLSVILIKKRSY